ncbi:hypothetical protein GCM10027589_54000 [Actinocorallia lasiicapitis]
MTRRLTNMIEASAHGHSRRTGECLDADFDFDVLLWRMPKTTIRRPDVSLFRCAPDDERPLPVHLILLAVEVVSGDGRTETMAKRSEYAAAGIPWYWLVHLDELGVSHIEALALDHGVGAYHRVAVISEKDSDSLVSPIRIELDWQQLRPGAQP